MGFFLKGLINPWFWSKIGHYSLVCFGSKISLEIVFDVHLVRKEALLDYKKADFIKWPYCIFFKGTMILVTTWKLLLGLFLDKIGLQKRSDDNQFRKHLLLPYKKLILLGGHNRIFLKGVTHDLCLKLEITPCFVFGQNRPRNNVWWSCS